MTRQDQLRHLKRSILNSMNQIEDLKGKMFHELMPEVDREFNELSDRNTGFNELIYNDYLRLKALDVNLKHYIDDNNFDDGYKLSKTKGDK